MHEKADSGEDETRGDKRIVRSLNIYSRRLGLSGRADVVEFNGKGKDAIPYPVEYKSGQSKHDICDMAQLCAQALCIEEMTNIPVHEAAIYYGRPRKRLVVAIDDDLRRQTEDIIKAIHGMVETRITPQARYQKKCENCSLYDYCMPGIGNNKLAGYIKELYTPHEETS